MDKVKINKAIDALSLSVDNKNTLKEALNQEYEADITEIETKVDTIDKGLGTAKTELNNKVDKVKGKQLSSNDYTTAEKNKLANLQNYTLPTATKTTLGGVKAITNIVNVDTETATAASLAGVVNTLLDQLRAAGIIQL